MDKVISSNAGSDYKNLVFQLQKCFIPENLNDDTKWTFLEEYHSKVLLEKDFNQTDTISYVTVLKTLIDCLHPDLFTEKQHETLFDDCFLHGIDHEAFLMLIKSLSEKKNYAQQKILNLLSKFIESSSLESMLLYQCVSRADWDLKYVSKSNFWNELITAIISLPEKIANQTKGKFKQIFHPSSYIPLLLHSIFKTLSTLHDRIKNSEDCSVEFLAKLTGRLCIIGNADIVAEIFSKKLISVSQKDFIWRRLSQNFITKIPSNSLDSFITHLLCTIPWYGYVEWIFGDEGVKHEKINFIMTVKVLFYRSFKKVLILQNVIGYFASSSTRVSSFKNILSSLLDSWMDEKAYKNQSAEQKIYIASALMICAGWIKHLKLSFENKDYINKVLKGTQIRLESSEEIIRSVGMLVGEHLIKSIDPESPPLKFEFSDSVILNSLKNLINIPPKPVNDSELIEDFKCFEKIQIENNKEQSSLLKDKSDPVSSKDEEFDSEDNIEPYDLSNDTPKDKGKRPFYVRECMMGLVEQENADWTEQCLKHAEELIKANAFATEEVAEEMTKILLHLDDTLSIPDFRVLRHRTLIALNVQCPIVVSNFLTSQFAERDYNIRQRLDILEVLAASSALLSHLPISNVSKKESVDKREAEWQLIVNQRLEKKTRRFTKTQQANLLENKFSAIAGNFFYPLLNSYERISKILKLDGADSYVLGRFIYTLGVIMCSASNTVHCSQMGLTFLQFLSTVKSHKDVFVRQSIIFAVAATYMGVPPSILLSEMLTDVLQANEWLQGIVQNDLEGDCVEKALYTLSIFQNIAAEGPLLLPHHLKSLPSFE